EVELRRGAPLPHHHVALFATRRNTRVRSVRGAQKDLPRLRLHLPEPRVELADPIAHLAHLADEGFGILTSTLPFPDLLRHRVAASLQRVGFGDQRASLLVQYEDPGHGAVGFLGGAAQPKAFANLFRALAD